MQPSGPLTITCSQQSILGPVRSVGTQLAALACLSAAPNTLLGSEAIFARIAADPMLLSNEAAKFAAAAARHIGDLNALHAFIEGNGRMQRIWLVEIARRAGYAFTSAGISHTDWYTAAAHSFERSDDSLMAGLIQRQLRGSEG
jgi:cell filamentation protein